MDETNFILVGVAILLVFIGIAIWGVRIGQQKHQPPADEATPRVEPTFSGDGAPPSTAAAAGNDEPAISATTPPQAELEINYTPPDLPAPDESLLHTDICFSINFYSERESIAASVFTALEKKVRQLQLAVYRQLGFDEAQQAWVRDPAKPCRYWLLAFPLADRSGRLSQERITLLTEEAHRFAQANGLHLRSSSVTTAIANAELLDEFCNTMDLVVEWRINLSKDVLINRIDDLLGMHHLTQEGARHVYRLDSETIFMATCSKSLSNHHGQSLLFCLDAPKVSIPEQGLTDMYNTARKIADALGAKITDPRGVAIDDARIAAIREQLTALRKKMTDFGVPPGSSTAHLLFS